MNDHSYAIHPYSPVLTPDSFMSRVWSQMVADDTAGKVFFERSVTTAEEFTAMAQSPGVHMYFLATNAHELLGVVWLERQQERWAQLSYCLFSNTWGPKRTIPLGRWVVRKLLHMADDEGFLLDMLVGFTPRRNRAACLFALRLGWKKVGVLPLGVFNGETGLSEPAMVTCITREDIQ